MCYALPLSYDLCKMFITVVYGAFYLGRKSASYFISDTFYFFEEKVTQKVTVQSSFQLSYNYNSSCVKQSKFNFLFFNLDNAHQRVTAS